MRQPRSLGRLLASRWWLVAVAAGVMGMAGTYQFAWSSIRGPVGAAVGADEAALGTVFTLYVVGQTTAQFPAGWVRDRYGPRPPLLVGAALLAAGFVGTARAPTIWGVYVSYGVGGVGAAIAYTVSVNTPVKWFEERRGLATGLVTMAYSGTSVVVIPLIKASPDIDVALVWLAGLAGASALAAAIFLRDPPEAEEAAGSGPTGAAAYEWREAVRTWQFWLLYGVFAVLNGVGLMVIGKAVALAGSFDLSAATATASASVIALGDAVGIILISAASDRLGRERTTGAMLVLAGASLAGALLAGQAGIGGVFVLLVGGVVFFRSPAFAIFPAMVGEYFGIENSSQNYALLYTAKLWGGILGGTVSSLLVIAVGWRPTFALGAGLLVLAGFAAFGLRPPPDAPAGG